MYNTNKTSFIFQVSCVLNKGHWSTQYVLLVHVQHEQNVFHNILEQKWNMCGFLLRERERHRHFLVCRHLRRYQLATQLPTVLFVNKITHADARRHDVRCVNVNCIRRFVEWFPFCANYDVVEFDPSTVANVRRFKLCDVAADGLVGNKIAHADARLYDVKCVNVNYIRCFVEWLPFNANQDVVKADAPAVGKTVDTNT
jgi:hypothetical protein